jgi:hypothetical protein
MSYFDLFFDLSMLTVSKSKNTPAQTHAITLTPNQPMNSADHCTWNFPVTFRRLGELKQWSARIRLYELPRPLRPRHSENPVSLTAKLVVVHKKILRALG